MTKLLTIYFDGAISAKFSMPPSGETMDRTQKHFDLKWWHGQPLSPCKIWRKSRDARRRERMKCDAFTGRICRRQLRRYFVYSRADFGVFRSAEATRCTDQGQIWQGGADRRFAPPCQTWPWSVPGWGFTAPKTEKNSNFTNIIVPKGRVPCTIFTKFTRYMRVLSLYNAAEFGCIISFFWGRKALSSQWNSFQNYR